MIKITIKMMKIPKPWRDRWMWEMETMVSSAIAIPVTKASLYVFCQHALKWRIEGLLLAHLTDSCGNVTKLRTIELVNLATCRCDHDTDLPTPWPKNVGNICWDRREGRHGPWRTRWRRVPSRAVWRRVWRMALKDHDGRGSRVARKTD